ncbi:unnamed protein product [Penicillium salamii]|uniref:Uncharacterized protein n=1 Tax=Penicillium salamii TaxID=1612424 RepID=A0A9W4IHH3_9EURO|nr:unnamed protein product [Penicillium salamii]CAG8651956.1 unnamed protein product [Penicillium salamii]
MLRHSEPLQSLFGRVIGDPTHRLECIWVKDDGAHCRNTVPKISRINGALCLGMFHEFPVSHSHEMRLSMAASYMLCAECSCHSSRSRDCAQRWMKLLHARANRVEQTTQIEQDGHSSVLPGNRWPNSMSYDAGTANLVLSASPFYHPVYGKAS